MRASPKISFLQAKDVFKPWADSKDKIPVTVTFQGTSFGGSTNFGSLEIDLNCPLDIAREFLRRAFWRELNGQNGAAFDFLQQGKFVREQDEPVTKMRDVAPQRLDSITRELKNVLIICASTTRENARLDPQIPEAVLKTRGLCTMI